MYTSTGRWEEKWRLKLTSARVDVEVEAELGKMKIQGTLLSSRMI